jgi:hypothetical protein
VILAGIDEAGYGPTLGPLVVSLAAFRAGGAAAAADPHDLWAAIGEDTVLRAPPASPRGERRAASKDLRFIVCDSKKLYHAGKGLRHMEAAVLACLALAAGDGEPRRALLEGTSLEALFPAMGLARDALARYPWYDGRDLALPCFGFRTVLKRQAAALARALGRAGLESLHLLPRVVHPLEFNGGVREAGNKHLFEWRLVGEHLRLLWDRYGEEGVSVVCDRLSGRDHYGPPLADLFPEARVTAAEEGALRSSYRVARGGRHLEVSFLVEGDDKAFLVALASCAAKYVRELFMRPLNDFFAARVPGLRATAGYYGDAQRFLGEIAPAWRALGLADDLLVRCC